jgi:hypothetical protein
MSTPPRKPDPKAIAVANLSQLQWFVDPNSSRASVPILGDPCTNGAILESLKVLGINVYRPNESLFAMGQVGEAISSGVIDSNILIVENPILDQLIAAGVSTPTLDAYAGKTEEHAKGKGRSSGGTWAEGR